MSDVHSFTCDCDVLVLYIALAFPLERRTRPFIVRSLWYLFTPRGSNHYQWQPRAQAQGARSTRYHGDTHLPSRQLHNRAVEVAGCDGNPPSWSWSLVLVASCPCSRGDIVDGKVAPTNKSLANKPVLVKTVVHTRTNVHVGDWYGLRQLVQQTRIGRKKGKDSRWDDYAYIPNRQRW